MLFTFQKFSGTKVRIEDQNIIVTFPAGKVVKVSPDLPPQAGLFNRAFVPKGRSTSLVEECDGKHACIHHGASCPEIKARKASLSASRQARTALFHERASARAAYRQRHEERVASQKKRKIFEGLRDERMKTEVRRDFAWERIAWDLLQEIPDIDIGTASFLSPKERNRLQHALNGNIFSASRAPDFLDLRAVAPPSVLRSEVIPIGSPRYTNMYSTIFGFSDLGDYPSQRSMSNPTVYGVPHIGLENDLVPTSSSTHDIFRSLRRLFSKLPRKPIFVRTTGEPILAPGFSIVSFRFVGDQRPYTGPSDTVVYLPEFFSSKTAAALIRVLCLALSTTARPVVAGNDYEEKVVPLPSHVNCPITTFGRSFPMNERTAGYLDSRLCPWTISRACMYLRNVYGADAYILSQMYVRVTGSDDVTVSRLLSPEGCILRVRYVDCQGNTITSVPLGRSPVLTFDIPSPREPFKELEHGLEDIINDDSRSVKSEEGLFSTLAWTPSSLKNRGKKASSSKVMKKQAVVAMSPRQILHEMPEVDYDELEDSEKEILPEAQDILDSVTGTLSEISDNLRSKAGVAWKNVLLEAAKLQDTKAVKDSAFMAALHLQHMRNQASPSYASKRALRASYLAACNSKFGAWGVKLFGNSVEANRFCRDVPLPSDQAQFEAYLLGMEDEDWAYQAMAFLMQALRYKPSQIHGLSQKQLNKLQHALNGNISPGELAVSLMKAAVEKLSVRVTKNLGVSIHVDDSDSVSPPVAPKVLLNGHGYSIKEGPIYPDRLTHGFDTKSQNWRWFLSKFEACCKSPGGIQMYKLRHVPQKQKKSIDLNMPRSSWIALWEDIFPISCNLHDSGVTELAVETCTLPSAELSANTVLSIMMNLLGPAMEGETCENESHTEDAIHKLLSTFPIVGRTSGAELKAIHSLVLGFGEPQCPLCWPDNPNWASPDFLEILNDLETDATGLFRLALHARALRPLGRNYGRGMVISIGEGVYPDIPTPWSLNTRVLPPDDEIVRGGYPSVYKFLELADAQLYCQPYFDRIAGICDGTYYLPSEQFHILGSKAFSMTRGEYIVTSSGQYDYVGWFVHPLDAVWSKGKVAAHLMSLTPGGGLLECQLYNRIGCNVLCLESLGSQSTPDLECEGFALFSPRSVPAHLRVVSVTNMLRYVDIVNSSAFAVKFGIAAFLGPVLDSTAGSSNARISLATWNDSHKGSTTIVHLRDVSSVKNRKSTCGCLQCLINHRYGKIFHLRTGTAGDQTPWAPYYRKFNEWGLDVVVVVHQSISQGVEDLRVIQAGGVVSTIERLLTDYRTFSGIAGFTIGHPATGADIEVSLAPPSHHLRRWVFRLGPALDAVLSVFSATAQTMPRIAAYPGILNLPRSADGKTFLTRSTSVKPRIGELWALGSSGHAPPHGAPVVIPGDHFSQFEKVEVVYTHGGAGTVQTAALAGARVVVVDQVLDRAYLDPMDAGAGVQDGQNPDKIILLLLARDFGPLFFVWRKSFKLVYLSWLWYFKLFFVSDLMTMLCLYQMSRDAIVLVPGSFTSSVLASLTKSVFGQGAAFTASLVMQVWGPMILAQFSLDFASIMMSILRVGRKAGRSVLGATSTGVFGWKGGLIGLAIEQYVLPLVSVSIDACRNPQSYLLICNSAWGPIHAAILSSDGQYYEGTEVAEGVYRLAPMSTIPHSVLFKIPMKLKIQPVTLRDQAATEYNGLIWNCWTVILAQAIGNINQLGLGLVVSLPFLALVTLVYAGSIIFLFGLILITVMFIILAPNTIKFLSPLIGFLSGRFRMATSMAMQNNSSSWYERAIELQRAMGTAAALSRVDLVKARHISAVRAEVQAVVETGDPSQIKELHDRMRALPRNQLEGVSDLLIAHGVFAATLNLPDDSDQIDEGFSELTIIVASLRDCRNLPSAGASLEEFNLFHDALDAQPDTIIGNRPIHALIRSLPFVHDPELSELLGSAWDDYNVGTIRELFSRFPEYGMAETSVLAAALDLDNMSRFGICVAQWLFFAHPEEDSSDPLGDAISVNDIDIIARIAAPAVKAGSSIIDATFESVLICKDIFQGNSVPASSRDAETRQAVEDVYEATQSLRRWYQPAFDALSRFIEMLSSSQVARTLSLPLHAIMSFLGFLVSGIFTFFFKIFGMLLVVVMESFRIHPDEVAWIMTRIMVAVSILDPQQRTKTKPVWALLWRRSREQLTKAEQFFFSLGTISHKASPCYSEWVDTMASHLDGDGVDTSALWRKMPDRAVYHPSRPVGLEVYNEMETVSENLFTEIKEATRYMEQSIAAGNPMTIDGVWMATAQRTNTSLSRYERPRGEVDSITRAALVEAADALFEKFPNLYDRPLPMTPSAVVRSAKWKNGSTGLPFIKVVNSREALKDSPWFAAVERAVVSILRSGELPDVGFHGFPKPYVSTLQKILTPYGLRTVTAGDRITACVINTVMGERNKRAPNIEDGLLNMERRSEGGILQLQEFYNRFPHKFSGDGEAFDSSVVAEVATVGSVRLFERGFDNHKMLNSKAASSLVASYYEALTKGFVVNLVDGSFVRKTGGGGTGSAGTTPDNRDWTRLSHIVGYSLVTHLPALTFFDHFSFGNASDDVFFSTDDFGKSILPQIQACMREKLGVNFTYLEEPDLNNILHLEKISLKQLEASHPDYKAVGIPVPSIGLRHAPKRLLLMRSAFRSDKVRLDNVIISRHIMERSTGYQMLTAHSRDMYDLVTNDWLTASHEFGELHFKKISRQVEYNENRNIESASVFIADSAPSSWLIGRAARFHRCSPKNLTEPAKNWIALQQRKAKTVLRATRGKSYLAVFELWVKTPRDREHSKVAQRWLSHRSKATVFSPVADAVRLFVVSFERALASVPKALIGMPAEKEIMTVVRPFNTWGFTIEMYIWRRAILNSKDKKVPTNAEMRSLIRESPFAAITDVGAFSQWLLLKDNLKLHLAETLRPTFSKKKTPRGVPSNDAIMGRVLALLALYSLIDVVIAYVEKIPLFGALVLLGFSLFRWLDVFYSFQSLAFWLCTGRASLAIANSVPKDKYIVQKTLTAILALAIPSFLTDYWVGVFKYAPYIGTFIETQTWIPLLLLRTNFTLNERLTRQIDGLWAPCINHILTLPVGLHPVVGRTGAGKSTSLPATLIGLRVCRTVILLAPTNALVEGYSNDFIEETGILRIVSSSDYSLDFNQYQVVTMTPAQWNLRSLQRRAVTNTVVLVDEVHSVSTDTILAISLSQAANFRVILLTATPGGYFERLFTPENTITVVGAPRAVRHGPVKSASYEQAVSQAVRDGASISDIGVYSPSVSKLKLWSTYLAGLGGRPKLITRDIQDTHGPGPTLFTGVVLAGANLKPEPSALIIDPTKLESHQGLLYEDEEDDSILDVPSFMSATAVEMRTVGLSPQELTQVLGRNGRSRDGRSYIITSHLPIGPLHLSGAIYPLLQIARDNPPILRPLEAFSSLFAEGETVDSLWALIDDPVGNPDVGSAFLALHLVLGSLRAVSEWFDSHDSDEKLRTWETATKALDLIGLTSTGPPLNYLSGVRNAMGSISFMEDGFQVIEIIEGKVRFLRLF